MIQTTVCCFTGHRQLPESEHAIIQGALYNAVISLIDRGVKTYCTGGALGFDTLAALTILHLRQYASNIRLHLILPCPDQAKWWNEKDAALYHRILSAADRTEYLAQTYYLGCMQMRNRRLVEQSGWCICYQRKPTGGTAYTVRYAEKQGLRIIRL